MHDGILYRITEEGNANGLEVKEEGILKSSSWFLQERRGTCTPLCMRGPALCNPTDCSLTGSSIHGILQGKDTAVGYHALLQGILPTPGIEPAASPAPPVTSLLLSYPGSPRTPVLPFKSEAATSQWFSDLSTHQKFLTQQSTVGPENVCF